MERPPYLAEPGLSSRRHPASRYLLATLFAAALALAFAAGRWTAPRGDAAAPAERPPSGRPAAPPARAALRSVRSDASVPAAAPSPDAAIAPAPTPALQGALFVRTVAPPAAALPAEGSSSDPGLPGSGVRAASEASLHDELVRCLSYTIEREEGRMPTFVESVRVRVSVRNRCDRPFAAADSAFEVRAVSARGGATAGRQIGHFQEMIPPLGSTETVLEIQASNGDFYRFEATPAADAGAGKRALE